MFVKCWKVVHYNAIKLLNNCLKSKKFLPKFHWKVATSISCCFHINVNKKFYFSFFTIIAHIGQAWNLAFRSRSQIWAKFKDNKFSRTKYVGRCLISRLADRYQVAGHVFKVQKVDKHSDMRSKPIFCSKVAQRGKTCSRLLEPQKVAPSDKSCSKVAEHNRDRPNPSNEKRLIPHPASRIPPTLC